MRKGTGYVKKSIAIVISVAMLFSSVELPALAAEPTAVEDGASLSASAAENTADPSESAEENLIEGSDGPKTAEPEVQTDAPEEGDDEELIAGADILLSEVDEGEGSGSGEKEIIHSGEWGDLTWTHYTDGTLVISGSGSMQDFKDGIEVGAWRGNGCCMSSVKSVIIEEGVTSVGDYAFKEFTKVTSITLPDGLTSIGEQAFVWCKMESLTIPGSVTYMDQSAFALCDMLTSVTISHGVTYIGPWAFRYSTNLESVRIPLSVISIFEDAFGRCDNLKHVYYEGSPSQWNKVYISTGNNCLKDAEIHYALCDINYVLNGGTNSSSNPRYYDPNEDDTIVLAPPTRDGYSFDGWYKDEAFTESVTQISLGGTENATVYAKWICEGYTGRENNIRWSFDEEEGILEISGTGAMSAFSDSYRDAWRAHSAKIRSVIINEGVTSIGNYAFYCCTNLTDISLPEGLGAIGSNAFDRCRSLQRIDLPEGLRSIDTRAFSECSSLQEINLPESLETLSSHTFYGCSNLQGIELSKNLSYIDNYVFYGCTGLQSIVLPESITRINIGAFSGCTGLQSVNIPKGVKSISSNAFFGCDGLRDVYYGGSVGTWADISLGSNNDVLNGATFHYAMSDITYVLDGGTNNKSNPPAYTDNGDTVQLAEPTRNGYAFLGWYDDADFTHQVTEIPAGSAGPKTFYAKWGVGGVYSSLKWALNEEGVLHIFGSGGISSFYEISTSAWRAHADDIRSVIIDEGVTSIGGYAFYNCANMESVVIPDSVTSVGASAFSGCSSLTEVKLPEDLTSISQSVFSGCSVLERVDIPSTVKYVYESAFEGCDSLSDVYYGGPSGTWKKIKFYDKNDSVKNAGIHYGMYDITYVSDISMINSSNPVGYSEKDADIVLHEPTSLQGIFKGWYEDAAFTKPVEKIPAGSTGDKTFYAKWLYTGIRGDLSWIYNPDDGTLTISGEGAMSSTGASWSGYKDNIHTVIIQNGATGIADDAFRGLINLTRVEIAASVTSIGSGAFYNCSSLTSVEIPAGVTSIGGSAFYNCSSLASIEIPKNVTTIGGYTFSGCSSLESVRLPAALTSISGSAFSGCNNLRYVYYGGSENSWIRISIGRDNDCLIKAPRTYDMYNITYVLEGGVNAASNPYDYLPSDAAITLDDASWDGNVFEGWYEDADHTKPAKGIPAGSTGDKTFYAGWTYNGAADNLTWNLNIDGTLTISGTGEMSNFSSAAVTTAWRAYSAKIKKVIIGDGVTSIGNYAFSDCGSLVSAELPFAMKKVGSYAFSGCDSLRHVHYDGTAATWQSVNRASGNDCLINAERHYYRYDITYVLNGGVNSDLNPSAYRGETGVTLADPEKDGSIFEGWYADEDFTTPASGIPAGSSGAKTFYALWVHTGTSGDLSWSFDVGSGILTISGSGKMNNFTSYESTAWRLYAAKIKKVVIEDGVTLISNYAFYNCTNLTDVDIPSSVTAIGSYAFYNCSNLQVKLHVSGESIAKDHASPYATSRYWAYLGDQIIEMTVEGQPERIGNYAFKDLKNLAEIQIPKSVRSIGDHAFAGCSSLTGIEIPDGVTGIGKGVFSDCSGVPEIRIPSSVTSIADEAFTGYDMASVLLEIDSANVEKDYVKSGEKPYWDNIKGQLINVSVKGQPAKFGDYVFYGCNVLKSIEIPNSVATIGDGAFYGCRGLKSIVIPGNVTAIGDSAFYGCLGLISAEISAGVTEIGESTFYNCTSLESIKVLGNGISIGDYGFYGCVKLQKIETSGGVTGVGNHAFYRCGSLTGIKLSVSVSAIGEAAFYECSNLKSINIPNSVTVIGNSAFSGCSGLTGINIPVGVTAIGAAAFKGCSSLTGINIPAGVTVIEDSTFYGCSGLTGITIPSGVTAIGASAFYGCNGLISVTLSSAVRKIGYQAFGNCGGLAMKLSIRSEDIEKNYSSGYNSERVLYYIAEIITEVIIEGQPERIGDYVFSNCRKLTKIQIPSSVTSIGASAFSDCASLTGVNIPETVTSLGSGAFSGCGNLSGVNIPNGVTSLGSSVFSGCSNLSSINIPNGVTSLGSSAFSYCSRLKSITIPTGVESIEHHAFNGCSSLKRIAIPDGVTKIEFMTFRGCTALTEVEIPDSVTEIEYQAFDNCTMLKRVKIPGEVKSIGYNAFYMCGSLESVEMEPSGSGTCMSIGTNAFYMCNSLKSIRLPGKVTNVDDRAFSCCSSLRRVEIEYGEQDQRLGYYAFGNCRNLERVTIPRSVNKIATSVFADCDGQKLDVDIEIRAEYLSADFSSNTLSEKYWYWYEGYVHSARVTVIGDGKPWRIGDNAFNGCVYLEEINIPEGLTAIGNSGFFRCYKLVGIDIPDSVTEIGNSAFQMCYALTDIRIPGHVETIGRYTFQQCTGLENVTILNGVKNIGDSAFNGCSRLCSIYLPASVEMIGSGAFVYCSALESVYFGESEEEWEKLAGAMESGNDPLTEAVVYFGSSSIVYHLNGGTNHEENPAAYDEETETIILKAPYRDGYIFDGWYQEDTFETKVTEIPTGSTGVVTLYAKWIPITYTVEFDGNGASEGSMEDMSCTYDVRYALPEHVFTWEEHTFTGWNTEADGSGTDYSDKAKIRNLAEDDGDTVTLYAQWEEDEIEEPEEDPSDPGVGGEPGTDPGTKPGEGTETEPGTKPGEGTETEPGTKPGEETETDPGTKPGEGTETEPGTKPGEGTETDSGTKPGEETEPETPAESDTPAEPEQPAEPDTPAEPEQPTEPETPEQSETPEELVIETRYTIVYSLEGGINAPANPDGYDKLQSDIVLAAPTREGYSFAGWCTDTALTRKVTRLAAGTRGDVVLYAKWEPNKYTISFDGNGATGGSMSAMTNRAYGTRYELSENKYKKTGNIFIGWNTKADGTGTAYNNRASVESLTAEAGGKATLYAQWRDSGYTITYRLNGGINHADNPGWYDENSGAITLKTPSKDGYTFDGWYSDARCRTSTTGIAAGSSGNVVFYAKWIAGRYNIVFDGNGADTGAVNGLQNKSYGKSFKLSANKFKRTGYTFAGWNTERDGSGTPYKNKAKVSDLPAAGGTATLYAMWTEVPYKIVYKLKKGKNDPENPATYTIETDTITLAEPTREGYTFDGWYSDSRYRNKVTEISTGSTGKKTFYAKWKK